MVLSTENNYYTNIISLVMLLVAPISGLTVKISRFSLDPTIAYIPQHLFKIYYFQFEHCNDTLQNIHAPYSCICLFSLFFTTNVYCSRIIFMALFYVQFSALHYIIFSVYTNLNLTECFSVHFKYFCKFSIKNITIWHFYSNFSTPAIFFEEILQGAYPSGKSQGNLIFLQGQGKVREFCKMVREIRKPLKVREKSGNFKIVLC